MREHLDTMPVIEAYEADCECPLCRIHERCEEQYVENFLGGSVMEPSHRIEVNAHGFCGRHFAMMYPAGNRLGLALITDTYMQETIKKINKIASHAELAAKAKAGESFLKRLGDKQLTKSGEEVMKIVDDCVFCKRLNTNMERYVYTLVYLYEHESSFRAKFAKSKGMCLKHFAQTLQMASEEMSAKYLVEFTETLAGLMRSNLERVEKDLEWFTLKFDYKNRDKPWGNSQDAVERALNKLCGKIV